VSSARRVLVGLIVVATAAFVVGVVLERHQSHNEAAETPTQRAAEGAARTTTQHTESGESGNESTDSETGESGESGGENAERGESGESGEGGGENAAHNESTKTTATPATTTAGSPPTETTKHSEASEKLLGVNPESTGLLVVAVLASLLLAAGVVLFGASSTVLGVVALAMAAFGALDVREVVHQADESRTGLMLLAALVAVLHFAAAGLAVRAAVGAGDTAPPGACTRAAS
jgi:hypothetical protein